jgi:protein-disulfide isomerase
MLIKTSRGVLGILVVAAGLTAALPTRAATDKTDPVGKFLAGFAPDTHATTPTRHRMARKYRKLPRLVHARKPDTAATNPVPAPDIRQSVRDVLASDPAFLRGMVADLMRNDPEIRRLFSANQPPAQPAPQPQAAPLPQVSPDNQTEVGKIEAIVRNYLLAHPELLEEVSAELSKRQAAVEAEKHEAGVSQNAQTIFNSPRGVTIGNKDGDVSFVEFFDYNCGYCKRAMTDMIDLMKADPKLKVILKEFPVLGPGSVEAAQVAVAVRMQDPGGKKYLDFHQKLLGGKGQADKARAMAAAKEAGLDMTRLEKDVASPEVRATLEENFKLAEAMGMNGTPSYVIGKQVVIGAIGRDGLAEKIGIARCGKATC